VKRDTEKEANKDKDKPNTLGEKKDNNNDSSALKDYHGDGCGSNSL
jgi:hypothetical protein